MDKLDRPLALWRSGEISDSQMALSFFLCTHSEKFPRRSLNDYLEQNAKWDIESLDKFQFKKIKSKARECLKQWVLGNWNLKLLETIPTPEQVLFYQARGIRPVTMKTQQRSKTILHREDALDFFCHDLEHGYMFFYDQNLFLSQRKFFQNIEKTLEEGLWAEQRLDAQFEERFVYLISDMNSHPEHYKAYLNAMLGPEKVGSLDFLFE